MVRAIFRESPNGNNDRVIAGDGPEAVIEEPMRIFAKSNTIPRVVVARIGKLMNVSCVNDTPGIDSRQSIPG